MANQNYKRSPRNLIIKPQNLIPQIIIITKSMQAVQRPPPSQEKFCHLSKGALWEILYNNNLPNGIGNPRKPSCDNRHVGIVLQLLSFSIMNSGRLMCSISDGAYVSNALPDDQFKSNLERMWLPNRAVVMCTLARVNKKVLVVETLEVVRTDVENQIGDPKFIADYKNKRRDCSSIWTTLPQAPSSLGTLLQIPE